MLQEAQGLKNRPNQHRHLMGLCGRGGRSRATGRVTVRSRGAGFSKLLGPGSSVPSLFFTLPFFTRSVRRIRGVARFGLCCAPGLLTALLPVPSSTTVGLFYQTSGAKQPNLGYLSNFNFGTRVSYIISLTSKIASALYSAATVIFKRFNMVFLLAPSGQVIGIASRARCVLVQEAFSQRQLNLKPAKILRLRRMRPVVRGVAKNPNDHPHGGRTKGVLRPKTPWGKNIKKDIKCGLISSETPHICSHYCGVNVSSDNGLLLLRPPVGCQGLGFGVAYYLNLSAACASGL